MTKVETVCPYFKKQIVVERDHFGVGEHATDYKTFGVRTARSVGKRTWALRSPSQSPHYLASWPSYAFSLIS
jgi:hypothetical protein